MEALLLLLFLAVMLVGIGLYGHQQVRARQVREELEEIADHLSDQMTYQLDQQTQRQLLQQQELIKQVTELRRDLYHQLTDMRESLYQNLSQNREATELGLRRMQESNERKLDDMRQIVDEKLEQTLQTRLQVSFETVSKQLESVNRGLGEMQQVARDVGSLNKVLSNTKTRGIMGEILLGQIIEDILTPSQYEREFSTVPGSTERVEYAVKMPGHSEGSYVYLPIDSKFPLEDYYRLEDAYELGDKEQVEVHRKSLLASVKRFAKDIRNKYLSPPDTTNFAILFLPTEGLYSEVVRNASFFDELRRSEQILVAGPSTLSALLNSLSVGFKTLNIQKSADDISKVLGTVKLEFGKFGGLLTKTQKQLQQASSTLDKLLHTRTNAIERALRSIELYEDDATRSFLEMPKEIKDGIRDENQPDEEG
ncbi:DNA recombination protein RmuC [Streptococcus sp. DD13]|uniref:DNA recombination protein RmuC n=1 Tax=Streptococcus sp. DD13 TaxID=1777881 RepID=UPI0007987F98|nr:DNA recombination protein RmuC [Streptococcus sp. DD13]KXT77702.1 DNA recombination protein RmuC [Streptococcus sp. DD13]